MKIHQALLSLSYLITLTFVPLSLADEIEDAEDLLKQKKFAEASAVLTDAVLGNAEDPDYARYLRATARFQAKQYAESQADCDAIGEVSEWWSKAIFLKAENLIALKNHGAVEAIYRAESDRLFSQERKEALAQLLIDFADELSDLPPNADAVLPEQSAKALALLAKALEIETSVAMKEEILFNKITLLRDGSDSQSDLQIACNDYLAKFDPDWTEPLGTGTKRTKDNQFKGQAGQHLWDVRLILFETEVPARNSRAMRRYARKVLQAAPNPGDVEWLIALSYRREPDRLRQQLLAFLEKYPNHGRSAEAAFTLATITEADNRIEAFESFLKRDNWPAPTLDRGDKTEPAARLSSWREQASYRIGSIHFDQGNYAEAIKQWTQYSKNFANGSLWATAQSQMVTAEFRNCLVPVDANDEPEARKRFEAFTTKYPLDGRVPQLLFLLGEFSFSGASKLQEDKQPAAQWKPLCEKAIADWSTLIAKYPDTYEANLALYRTGSLQFGPLEQFEEALESLKKVRGEAGQSVMVQGQSFANSNNNLEVGSNFQGQTIAQNDNWGDATLSLTQLATSRIALLEDKSLSLTTERVYRTNEPANVSLQVRNIEKVTISRYTLDLERFFRSHHRFDTDKGIESLDIDLIQPDETWTIEIDDFAKYKVHDLKVDSRIAGNDPGVCIIRAEADDWQASTVVLRSNVDLITQSTWREGLVFAQDSVTNEKIAGARVLVTNGEELIGEGQTDEQGIYRLKGQMIRDSVDLCFYVSADQGQAMKRLNLTGMTQEITGGRTHDDFAKLTKKGYLYTAKDNYRPGETVNVRGVLRDVLNGVYTAKPNAQTIVTLFDSRGKSAREWRIPLSEFGTFEVSFLLPEKADGYFVVKAKLDEPTADLYATRFRVRGPSEEDKPRLEFEFESPSVLAGEVIRGKVVATQPWGEPIINEPVELIFPDGRKQEAKTDEFGEISFNQETTELGLGNASFRANFVHHRWGANSNVLIQPAAFRLAWKRWPDTTLAGEPLKFGVEVLSETGEPLAQQLEFEIEKLPAAAGHGVLSGLPTVAYHRQPKDPESVIKRELNSAVETGIAETEATLEEPGSYRIVISGEDRADNLVRQVRNLVVESKEDDSKLRIFADETNIAEGETLKLSIHSGVAAPLALLTLGGADVLETRPIELIEGHNELEIPIQAEHWPKFDVTVTYLLDSKLEVARRTIDVKRELQIEIVGPEVPVEPGANVEFSIATTNSLGEPVAAELSLGLSGNKGDHIHQFLEMFRKGQRPGASFRFGSTAGFRHSARSQLSKEDETAIAQNHRQKLAQIVVREHFLCAEIPTPLIQLNPHEGARELLEPFNNDSPAQRWSGPIVTDANGKATVTMTLPNSVGDWGVSAIGCDRGRLLGSAISRLKTASPIELRLLAPQDLRAGDTWRPEAVVTLNSDEARTLTLVSRIGGANDTKQIEVEAGRRQRVIFDPREIDPREITAGETISWSVRIDDLSQTAEIPVRPRGIAIGGSASATIDGQAGQLAVAGHIAASFYARPEALLADLALGQVPAIPGIDREPQTEVSALLAATSALRLARSRDLESPELEAEIEALILAVQVTQQDGGWTWQGVDWQRGSLTTSLGLWGLREAKELGFYVNEDLVTRGVEYLTSVLAVVPPQEPEKTAMILFALALEDAENFSIANRLHRERESLNPATLAFLAGAFLRMERAEEANQLLEVLLAKSEDDTWPGSERVARLSQPGDISALALWALARAKSDEATRIAHRLLSRGGVHFGAESALQGLWIAALGEHFLNQPAVNADSEVTLKLNGKDWVTLNAERSHASAFSEAADNQVSYSAANGILLLTWATAEENPTSTDDNRALLPEIVSRDYYPSNRRHGDAYLSTPSTSPVTNAESGQILRVLVKFKKPEKPYRSFIQIEEPIPAGCILKPGSIFPNHAKFEQDGNVLRITGLPGWSGQVGYELVALTAGTYYVPPTLIRDDCRPSRFRLGAASTLTVLPPGQKTPDEYQMNASERYELARLLFESDAYDEALVHLEAIEKNHTDDAGIRRHEREISRMLLWIHTTRPDTDAKRIVERFEALSERHADVVIPFDKIIKVAQAYKALNELERSWLVYRAMIESNFINDATIAMALKDQGDFLGYRDAQLDLWAQYPNAQDVLFAYFALAQDLEENSLKIDDLTLRKDQEKPTKEQLLELSRDLLERYMTLYTDSDQADAAAFSLANVYFDLKDYGKVASRAETAALIYPKSSFLSSFQYMAALGHFWKYQFPDALKAAEPVANGRTENAASAKYIIAQVHQAQGNPIEAITWYEKVRYEFRDAADSLEGLEEKGVKLPDAVSFQPGEDVNVDLSYRNIREADIQIYKVDLMRLYSRQKELANIANVSLAGISPEAELKVNLGEGKDYDWKKRELKLPIKNEGAYLLVCRGDSTFASGLVIVTPLELKVREKIGQGEIRLHLWDRVKKAYVADAEINAFDSRATHIQKGRTDPRGAFNADGINGYAAVVVKHGDTRYAYHRSAAPLSPLIAAAGQNDMAPSQSEQKPASLGKDAYFRQLKGKLKEGSNAQKEIWSEKLQKGGKGVKASKAYKF